MRELQSAPKKQVLRFAQDDKKKNWDDKKKDWDDEKNAQDEKNVQDDEIVQGDENALRFAPDDNLCLH